MDVIKYETTLKAQGNDYKKIVFWNRFLRNPVELILTWIPAVLSIILIALGFFNTYLAVIYTAFWCYPVYIFFFQFKSNVNHHLKHRDPAEDAKCAITLTSNNIMAEIPDFDLIYTYNWDEYTTIYYKYGYYMMFNKSKMIVMLNTHDMSSEQQSCIGSFIKKCVDMNVCKVTF